MRTYELILVFDSSLEIEQIEAELKKVQEIITRDAGLIRVWERWGKRRLAYEIRRRQYGYYSLVVFDVEANLVRELERSIRLTTSILRHLITIVDPSRVPEVDEESVATLGAARTGGTEEDGETAGNSPAASVAGDESDVEDEADSSEVTAEATADDEGTTEESSDENKKTEDVA